MKQHEDLSLKTGESTSVQRAAGFSKEQVERFFVKLVELMDKFKFNHSKMFNAHETGVTCVHSNRLKVLSVKGKNKRGN